MKFFQEGKNISEIFDQSIKNIRCKLMEYNYRQLKDFSQEEIELMAFVGNIENVEINFDSPDFSVRQGKMKAYNHFRNFAFESEYYDVDALIVDVKIPVLYGEKLLTYRGNPTAFTFSARPFDMDIVYLGGKPFIVFSMSFQLSDVANLSPEETRIKVRKEYDDCIYGVKFYYELFRDEIDEFNKSLFDRTRKIINEIVKKDSILEAFSQAIGVEVSPKNIDRKKGEKITIAPRKIHPAFPDKKTYDGYYIDNSNYKVILQTIREHLISTEILPKPIQKLSDEELIRDTILWALNANYIVATGETFRAGGKTDINISFGDKSAFIAECKVWHGPNTFNEALNQIYGYTTWRDCRIAILIFNLAYKDFGRVRATLEKQIKENENYISCVSKSSNEWECKFINNTDEGSQITVNVIVSDYCLRK